MALFVDEGPWPSEPWRRAEPPTGFSPSPLLPPASQADLAVGTQRSSCRCRRPASGFCTGGGRARGGAREEVRGLSRRVKEVAQNEEAPCARRLRRLRRREKRAGASGLEQLPESPTDDAPALGPATWTQLPELRPAPPRPRLTCAGRCGARSHRSAAGRGTRSSSGLGRRRGWDAAVCPLGGFLGVQAHWRDTRSPSPLKKEGKLM